MTRADYKRFDRAFRTYGRHSDLRSMGIFLPGIAAREFDGGRKYISQHAGDRVLITNLHSFLADARGRKNWHDFLVYRERLRANREGRKEKYIPYFAGRPTECAA